MTFGRDNGPLHIIKILDFKLCNAIAQLSHQCQNKTLTNTNHKKCVFGLWLVEVVHSLKLSTVKSAK